MCTLPLRSGTSSRLKLFSGEARAWAGPPRFSEMVFLMVSIVMLGISLIDDACGIPQRQKEPWRSFINNTPHAQS